MSLDPGTRLGPYEIHSAIGAGGMGEVYRARDTKLGRDVALKMLPEHVAADPERLARLHREAQVLASLNHPNIAAIYGLEDSGNTHALVLELVDGETLADRISRGPIPLDEALPIVRQIAQALEAAHEQGIIHRDLKPANIKMRPDGAVKVLDFGLAKLNEPNGPNAPNALSMSPTITSPALVSGLGVLLGTAAYMSPEQAKGKPADKRSDIWAFGCVLYEMLTGDRVFQGEDITDTLAAVVKDTPHWDRAPRIVHRALRACLEKDRGARLRDIGDVWRLIDEPVDSIGPPRWQAWTGWGVAVALAVAVFVLFLRSPLPAAGVPTRLVVSMPPTHELFTGGGATPAISRDGRTLVYVGVPTTGGRRLYRRTLDQLDAVEIPNSSVTGVTEPSLSPDGKRVAFSAGSASAGQFTVGLDGGGREVLAPGLLPTAGSTWLDNSTLVFTATEGSIRRLFRVPLPGGSPVALTTPPSGAGNQYPHAKGSLLAYTLWSGSLDSAKVVVRSLETSDERVLLSGSSPKLLATGQLVFARQGALWIVGLDASRLQAVGDPIRAVENVQVNTGGLALYDVSDNGTLVYVPGMSGTQRSVVWVDRQGRESSIAAAPKAYNSARISPDGRHIALEERNVDIWIWDDGRALLTRLTIDPAADGSPEWTPDGRRLVFASEQSGTPGLFSQIGDGSVHAERLTGGGGGQIPLSFARDGRLLVRRDNNKAVTLQLLSLGPPARTEELVPMSADERNTTISPDGAWAAYDSSESGLTEVYVRRFPDAGGRRWQVSSGGGSQPAWSKRGDELFFVRDQALVSVAVKAGTAFEFGGITPVLPERYALGTGGRRPYDVSPDGQRFVMLKERAADQIIVIENWFEELKRLAATK